MHLYIPLYSLGRTLDGSVGALGEFWEVMYIKKLPINRPCSRYVMHKNHYFLFGDEVGYMIPCRSFICFHVLVPTSIFVRNIEIPQNSSLIKQIFWFLTNRSLAMTEQIGKLVTIRSLQNDCMDHGLHAKELTAFNGLKGRIQGFSKDRWHVNVLLPDGGVRQLVLYTIMETLHVVLK